MTKTGTTNVPVKVTYPDGSEVVLEVPVVVKNTDKDIYTPTSSTLEKPYGSTISDKDITDKVTVPHFVGDATKISYKVKDTKKIPGGNSEPGAYTVPVTVTYPDGTSEDVDVNVTILNKDSDSYEPTAKTLTKKHGETISNDDITGQVSVPNYPTGKKQPNKNVGTGATLPNTNTPSESNVPVTVTYPDGTTDTVNVHVVVKDADANTHTPQAEPLERNIDSGKPSDSDITSKVTIPNWPAGEKDNPTYSIADSDKAQIPAGDKAGKFEVPVTVTYPDGSKTLINVPVIIKAPKPQAKTGMTVPKGAEPKPEDMISNKDKFPDGTIFEWTEKPDTSEEGNNKSGKVKITIPGSTTQEVPVKVNVVDPSASEVNVPQDTDLPNAKDVINNTSGDGNKYPEGTKFEWKPENTPDTSNSGKKDGVILVTLPGQSPVEVPVTVNVTPNPETNVVNVKVDGNLPDASKGIANKDKFPKGTTFEWKDGGPKTDKSGTTNGTVLIHIPGVKDPVKAKVTVNVNPAPTAQDTSVIQNSDPDPKNSIKDNDKLPKGTTFEWKKDAAPKTDKTGPTTGTVIVKIPGQEPQTVKVKVNVIPAPEVNNITVLQKKSSDTTGKEPNAEDAIANKGNFPEGTQFKWKEDTDGKKGGKPDTSHVGNQPSVVTITVPGMTPVDVPVNVLVVPNPEGKTVNVPVNAKPKPEDSIANNGDFPDGTTFEWEKDKDGKETGKPDTSKTGDNVPGTVLVKIPGLKEPVKVQVTLKVTDKPFINDSSAKNTPENPDKTTITGNATPGATITVQDDSGNALKDDKGNDITTKVDDNGHFTVDVPKKDSGTKLKLVPSKDGKSGTPVEVAVIAKPKAPTITVPSENEGGKKSDGNVTVTPTKDDNATVVTIVITAKPNPLNGPEKPVRTIVVKKGDDGTWKKDGDVPEGVTVDPKTGEVKIPAKDLEDGSTITAVAKDKDDHSSDKAEKTTGFKTPQITGQSIADEPSGSGSESGGDQGGSHGSQKITGKTDVPGATITVTDKDGKQIGTGKADKDGNFTITINKQTPGAIVNLTPTNGTGDFAKTGNTVEVTVGGDIAVPRIDTPADGSATITPNLTDTRVDKVVITYTPEGDGSTPQTVTVTVIAEGDMRVWKIDGTAPNGVTVDPKTGVVTIPAANVKDGSKITAFAKNSADSSSTVTGTIAQPGDGGSGDSGDSGDDSGSGDSGESGSHANNANNANNANKNGSNANNANKNGSNNHGNQSRNSGSNSGSRRGKGALGNTGVGVALSALASAMLAGMGAAGRAVSRRKKRNQLVRAK